MKLPFSKTREIIYQIIQDVFLRKIDNRYIATSNSAFSFTGYSDDNNCLYLYPNEEKPLYCIKIVKKSNMPSEISYFKRLLEIYGGDEDARLFIFYSKSPVLFQNRDKNFCTKNTLYIFSHSKSLLKEIANYYEVDLLKPMDIVRALLDIGLNNSYITNEDDLTIKAIHELNEIPTDELYYIFKALFAEGVYETVTHESNGYKVYQAIGTNSFFTKGKPDLISAIKLDWRGYFAITMELNQNNIRSIIATKKSMATKIETNKFIKDGFKMLYEAYSEEPSDYVVVNILYVTDNIKILQQFSEALNINFIEKKIFKKDYVYMTPIRIRDTEYDFVLPTEDAKKFISSFILDNQLNTSRVVESCGKDITNNYTQFTFFATALPHTAIIAKSRSGKTFFIQKVLADSMRAKVKLNEYYVQDDRDVLENSPVIIESAKRLLNREIGIVHFDVGYSAKKFVNQLKKYAPNQVDIYSDNLNLLRFGLTNVRVDNSSGEVEINKSDALFMIQTINTILELSGQSPLTANESNKIINALAKLFFEKTYQGLTIQQLREIGGYDELIERLKDYFGEIDEYATTVELDLPEEFNFLKVPLLQDVINELELLRANFRTSVEDKEIITSAISKLKSFEGNKMFWYYAKNNVTQADYFYMELESIKKLGEQIFIPVYIMMFQSLYRRDIENAQYFKDRNKDTKEVIYIIEEAHNFFKVSSFAKMFEALSREAARYGIVLVFITQNAKDIPEDVLLNLGNKIMMPSSGEDRELQITELPYLFQLEDDQNKEIKKRAVEFFKKYAERFSAVIQNSNGIFTFKPYASKEDVWLFNSDAIARKV